MKNLFSIPARSHYGILFLSYLKDAGDDVISTARAAQELGISQAYLEEIAWQLARAGFLQGVLGMRGGYRLARDPTTITIKEIFEALEGPLALTGCLKDQNHPCTVKCGLEQKCHPRSLLEKVQRGIAKQLEEVTLAGIKKEKT